MKRVLGSCAMTLRLLTLSYRSSAVGARRFSSRAAAQPFAEDPDFYFRQLKPGRDIALGGSQVEAFAQQMANFIYLLGDKRTGEAWVVDGAWDPVGINAVVRADNMTLVGALCTHYHWDHIGGEVNGVRVPGIADYLEDDLPVWLPELEMKDAAKQTSVDAAALSPIVDNQCMELSPRFSVEFLLTPGHSPGSTCFRVTRGRRDREEDGASVTDLLLITGDTVFPGSCGRLDLPGSDPRVMYDSLQRLAALPEDLVIFPGHGYNGESSTVGREKQTGLLRPITRQQWEMQMVR